VSVDVGGASSIVMPLILDGLTRIVKSSVL
jgi:hypothetical protein